MAVMLGSVVLINPHQGFDEPAFSSLQGSFIALKRRLHAS